MYLNAHQQRVVSVYIHGKHMVSMYTHAHVSRGRAPVHARARTERESSHKGAPWGTKWDLRFTTPHQAMASTGDNRHKRASLAEEPIEWAPTTHTSHAHHHPSSSKPQTHMVFMSRVIPSRPTPPTTPAREPEGPPPEPAPASALTPGTVTAGVEAGVKRGAGRPASAASLRSTRRVYTTRHEASESYRRRVKKTRGMLGYGKARRAQHRNTRMEGGMHKYGNVGGPAVGSKLLQPTLPQLHHPFPVSCSQGYPVLP